MQFSFVSPIFKPVYNSGNSRFLFVRLNLYLKTTYHLNETPLAWLAMSLIAVGCHSVVRRWVVVAAVVVARVVVAVVCQRLVPFAIVVVDCWPVVVLQVELRGIHRWWRPPSSPVHCSIEDGLRCRPGSVDGCPVATLSVQITNTFTKQEHKIGFKF